MKDVRISQLPSLPTAVVQLLNMLANPDVVIDDVVEVLKTDPALSAKVLRAANASSLGVNRNITNLKRASILLGTKTVTTLSLSFTLAESSLQGDSEGDLFHTFWDQSLTTAIAASLLATKSGSQDSAEAFVIGLLLRVGRLGALYCAPQDYRECVASSLSKNASLDSIKLESIDSTCDELTEYLFRLWRLPDVFVQRLASVQEAAWQDRTQSPGVRTASARSASSGGRSAAETATTNMRAAAAMGDFFVGENAGIALAVIHELLDPILKGSEEQLDSLLSEVHDQFHVYEEIVRVDSSGLASPAEIHAQAMSQLFEIAIAPDGGVGDSHAGEPSETDWLRAQVHDLASKLAQDPLTSVHNRKYFDERLCRRVCAAQLLSEPVGILFIDINKFKEINDTYGHDVGDQVICEVGETLQQSLREKDLLARYGGDEFVVLSEVSAPQSLEIIGNRFQAALAERRIPCAGEPIQVSVSIGGAIGVPDGSPEFGKKLLRAADSAMYEMKRSCGNTVTIHDMLPKQVAEVVSTARS